MFHTKFTGDIVELRNSKSGLLCSSPMLENSFMLWSFGERNAQKELHVSTIGFATAEAVPLVRMKVRTNSA
jgi:hypothetical protein